jgi:hypothetical protein
MKTITGYSWGMMLCCLLGCSQNEPSLQKPDAFTGNEVTYELVSASEFNVSGTATLKERCDGSTSILISLSGIDGSNDMELPVHLHYGDVTGEDAEVAALLNPVKAKLNSETVLTRLSDESLLTFSDLKQMDACIKIHLSATGDGRNVVLSAGNIGSAYAKSVTSGRLKIGTCKSE